MIQTAQSKPVVFLHAELFDEWPGQLDVFFAVVVHFHEHSLVPAVECVLEVVEAGSLVLLVELVVLTLHNRAQETQLASPASLGGGCVISVNNRLANVIKVSVVGVTESFNEQFLVGCCASPLGLVNSLASGVQHETFSFLCQYLLLLSRIHSVVHGGSGFRNRLFLGFLWAAFHLLSFLNLARCVWVEGRGL